jgi:itaconate CoA-transferase
MRDPLTVDRVGTAVSGGLSLKGGKRVQSGGDVSIIAIEMDLAAACNSEYVDGHQFTSTGGRLDCVRGPDASKGGISFIAFRASIKGGKISEIVARLSGPATTPRTNVHYVVTRNGVANLKGLASTERAHALIGLADPAFREGLTAAAREAHPI